jgi:TRAP-type C4-dicarboxylate transport system substrate-binding protein
MKKYIAMLMALVMILSLCACGSSTSTTTTSTATETTTTDAATTTDEASASNDDFHIELKLSHVFAPTEQLTVEMEMVADRIRERTNGAVDIQCYGSSQLAVYKDNLQQVVDGANWIACEDPSYLADYDIDFEALIAPMLYTTLDEYSYVCQSDIVKQMCQGIEDNYGIHVLALDFNVGLRCMQTNKVITTPDDLKGMKIRVPNSSMYINCLTAMGATPTPMGFSETISAVQQGVVDGLEGNMNAYSTNGSADVAKQMSFTNHLIGTCGAYINIDVWNSIPEEYRDIIQEEFSYGARELTDFTNESFESTMKMLEEEQGCSFNEVDVDAFRAVMETEYDRMVAEDGVTEGFIPQLQALVAEYDAMQ